MWGLIRNIRVYIFPVINFGDGIVCFFNTQMAFIVMEHFHYYGFIRLSENYLSEFLVDYFTKWPEAIAIPDKKAETIASSLDKNFLTMGFPAIYSSDQGRVSSD
jgi:hypothetical protein